MTINEKLIDIKCNYAEQYVKNLYTCEYFGQCKTQMDFGNTKYCREEIKKTQYETRNEQK